MRIIVISDTHGSRQSLDSVFLRNADADRFIHLGDGERDLDGFLTEHPWFSQRTIHVAGNCDFGSLSPGYDILHVFDHKILMTHGHIFGVKGGLEPLKDAARRNGCDIIFFGHTHVRYNKYEEGLYILNPGSAGCPHDGTAPSFGVVNIFPQGVVMNIADI